MTARWPLVRRFVALEFWERFAVVKAISPEGNVRDALPCRSWSKTDYKERIRTAEHAATSAIPRVIR